MKQDAQIKTVRRFADSARSRSACFGGLALLILAITYRVTLLPSTGYSGDTAKFQFVGAVLGTPHATGYPTYVVLNHLFTGWFPWGSLAWKANLLSALLTLAAAGFFFGIVRLLGLSPDLAAATTLLWGFLFTVWSQSIVAEVYSLHLLFVCATLYWFLKWRASRAVRYLLLGCAVYAVSFGNHLSTISLLPGLLYLVWSTDPQVFRNRRLVVSGLALAMAGVSQYAYIFWRSADRSTPYLEMQALDLPSLLWWVTGAQFRHQVFPYSLAEFLSVRIPRFLGLWFLETVGTAPLAVYGWWRLGCRRWRAFFALLFLANVLLSMNYDIPDFWIYLLPAWTVSMILLGLALEWILSLSALAAGRTACLILLVLVFASLGWPRVKEEVHLNPATRRAARVDALMETISGDTLVVASGYDETEFLYYHVLGLGRDRDRIFVARYFFPQQLADYLRAGRTFSLLEVRRELPPGLRVLVSDSRHIEALKALGLTTREFAYGYYEVEP